MITINANRIVYVCDVQIFPHILFLLHSVCAQSMAHYISVNGIWQEFVTQKQMKTGQRKNAHTRINTDKIDHSLFELKHYHGMKVIDVF